MPDTADRIATLEAELVSTAAELARLLGEQLPTNWTDFLALPWSVQERFRAKLPGDVKKLERAYYGVINAGGRPR